MNNPKLSFVASENAALAELICWYGLTNKTPLQTYSISLNLEESSAAIHRWERNFSNVTIYETPLEHPCITCAIIETSSQWFSTNLPKNSHNLIVLPEGAALDYVLPALAQMPEFQPETNSLTSCLYLCDEQQLKQNLFETTRSADEDENPSETAQTILNNIRYADHTCTPAMLYHNTQKTSGEQLLNHLRRQSPNGKTDKLSLLKLEKLFQKPHHYSHSLDFLDPLNENPCEYHLNAPLWHENIRHEKMVNPDQLLKAAEKLAKLEIIGQGHFHLPTRAETCVWQFAGGSFTLGLAGKTHRTGTTLEITGTNYLEKPLVEEILSELLINHQSAFSHRWIAGKDCFAEIL